MKTVCIANVCLFLALVLGHSIPPTFNMGKTGKKWFLIIFFGLLVGIAFNIVLPSSLHIVTDAWEAYQNSTKDNDTDIFFDGLFQLFLDLGLRFTQHVLDDGFAGFRIVTDRVASFPSTVLSFADVPFPVCSSLWHGISPFRQRTIP